MITKIGEARCANDDPTIAYDWGMSRILRGLDAAYEMLEFNIKLGHATHKMLDLSAEKTLLVVSGVVELEVDSVLHVLRPGDAFTVAAGVVHRMKTTRSNATVVIAGAAGAEHE